MKTGGKILSSFLPRCHSGSYVTLLCVCLLPASCCHSAFLIPLPFLPHSQCSPHSLSIPFDPQKSPFLFYSSSLKPQVSFHLPSPHPASSPWTPFTNVLAICGLVFYQPFCTLLQAKTLAGLILVRAGSKHITHNRTFPLTNRVITYN